MPNILVIKTPNCYTICDRSCCYERGAIFLVSKKKWGRIVNFLSSIRIFDDNRGSDYDGFYCTNYNPEEYVKKCEIIATDPSKHVIALLEKIEDSSILDNLLEVVEYYQNKDSDSNSE